MGKFTGVLLASDFDNTLIYTEEALRTGAPVPPLPERNREALVYFMAQGGRFAVSTGRALAAFLKYAELVPMNAPGVVCNGAALYDFQTGEYLETWSGGRRCWTVFRRRRWRPTTSETSFTPSIPMNSPAAMSM